MKMKKIKELFALKNGDIDILSINLNNIKKIVSYLIFICMIIKIFQQIKKGLIKENKIENLSINL